MFQPHWRFERKVSASVVFLIKRTNRTKPIGIWRNAGRWMKTSTQFAVTHSESIIA